MSNRLYLKTLQETTPLPPFQPWDGHFRFISDCLRIAAALLYPWAQMFPQPASDSICFRRVVGRKGAVSFHAGAFIQENY
ncbi:Hypothetical predicted protein [Cloeon dipterum]|uniref:Uncharacterized protein n=1 Tax=Cloeon dipterum TaxID=197152 RepID=A0A8S1C4Q6_9INSE|nr:Hypothetical predicted protein [Cloeon dipterum]